MHLHDHIPKVYKRWHALKQKRNVTVPSQAEGVSHTVIVEKVPAEPSILVKTVQGAFDKLKRTQKGLNQSRDSSFRLPAEFHLSTSNNL